MLMIIIRKKIMFTTYICLCSAYYIALNDAFHIIIKLLSLSLDTLTTNRMYCLLTVLGSLDHAHPIQTLHF